MSPYSYLPNYRALVSGLYMLFLLSSCGEMASPTSVPLASLSPGPGTTEPTQALMANTTCANGDLGERSKLYNQTTLPVCTTAFHDHFKVLVNNVRKDVKNTSVSLSVAKLNTLRGGLNPEPYALWVHYGLNGDEFYPVFEFMSLEANGATVKPMNTYYLAVNGELKKADTTLPDPVTLMDNYRTKIRFLRTDGDTNWYSINTDPNGYPDPLGEWFQFNLELDRLVAENSGSTELVLNCISEVACYSAVNFTKTTLGKEEEYRHMIAWFMSKGGTAQLDTTSLEQPRTNGNDYYKRAADLGHLCPPRCK